MDHNLNNNEPDFNSFPDVINALKQENDGNSEGNDAVDLMIKLVKKQANESGLNSIFSIRDIIISQDSDSEKVARVRLLFLKNMNNIADSKGKKDPEEYGIDSSKFQLAGRKKLIEFMKTIEEIQQMEGRMQVFVDIIADEELPDATKVAKLSNALLTTKMRFTL